MKSDSRQEDLIERKLELADGTYYLRPLKPGDEPLLQDFFYSHTAETVQHRYGYSVKTMSEERAAELVGVNQDVDRALAIVERDEEGNDRIHAVGRFFIDHGGKGAECAFVTRERKRRLGMASIILEELIKTGRERRLQYLWAYAEQDNKPMLHIFKKFGGKVNGSHEPTRAHITIPLTPQE